MQQQNGLVVGKHVCEVEDVFLQAHGVTPRYWKRLDRKVLKLALEVPLQGRERTHDFGKRPEDRKPAFHQCF